MIRSPFALPVTCTSLILSFGFWISAASGATATFTPLSDPICQAAKNNPDYVVQQVRQGASPDVVCSDGYDGNGNLNAGSLLEILLTAGAQSQTLQLLQLGANPDLLYRSSDQHRHYDRFLTPMFSVSVFGDDDVFAAALRRAPNFSQAVRSDGANSYHDGKYIMIWDYAYGMGSIFNQARVAPHVHVEGILQRLFDAGVSPYCFEIAQAPSTCGRTLLELVLSKAGGQVDHENPLHTDLEDSFVAHVIEAWSFTQDPHLHSATDAFCLTQKNGWSLSTASRNALITAGADVLAPCL